MAKLKQRADGRYLKTITDPRTGKRVYFYGTSEREINKKILEYTEKKTVGRTFKEVADEWWDIEVEQLSPSTVRGYNNTTKRAKDFFGSIPITNVTTADITRYLHHLARQGFSKKTVKNHKIVVSRILHFATVECYIKHNPARDAEMPRNLPEKKRKPATPTEENAIRSASEDEWILPYFALMTGMRRGELIGLKWSDIDLEHDLIHVQRSVWYGDGTAAHIKSTKTEAGQRMIPILVPLKERIMKEIKKCKPIPDHYVFGDEKPLTEKAYRHLYKKYKERVGISSTLHQLRKSFATAAVDANIPVDVLKEIIGHRDISTTLNIYAEVRESRIKEAGNALSNMMKNNA